jgi:hypothetical protein
MALVVIRHCQNCEHGCVFFHARLDNPDICRCNHMIFRHHGHYEYPAGAHAGSIRNIHISEPPNAQRIAYYIFCKAFLGALMPQRATQVT